jgi:hypothetical protein
MSFPVFRVPESYSEDMHQGDRRNAGLLDFYKTELNDLG